MNAIDRIRSFFEDPLFKGGKAAAHVAGKASIKGGMELAIIPTLLGMGIELDKLGTSLIIAPAAAVLSSALVVADYFRRKDLLLEQYRPQIAAWLARPGGASAKSADMLGQADLDLAAFGDEKRGIEAHPVLKETLEQSAKERNWGIAISALSSVASTVIIGGLMHDALHPAEGMLAGHDLATVALRALIGGAIGFALYLPITAGLHWLAEHMFGLEKVTANDHVREIERARERGEEISPSQVLETFVKANPELDRDIKAAFGRRLFKMNGEERQLVLEMVEPQLGIIGLTQAINSGALKPEDLAFVEPGALLQGEQRQPVAAEAQPEQTPEREVSFVKMVGKKQGQNGEHSFAQAVEQSRTSVAAQLIP